MDKIYISKEEMRTGIKQEAKQLKPSNNAPILVFFVFMWLIICLLFVFIPFVIISTVFFVLYIPFYFIDNLLFRRRK